LKERIKKIAIVLNVLLLIAVYCIYNSHSLQKIDNLLLDFNMTQTADHEPDSRIVVVAIDDASLDALGRFPWDRAVYAPFLENMNQEGNIPKAIAFDIVFSEQSDNPDSDMAFAEALAEYPNVILPVVGNMGDLFNTSIAKPDELIKANSWLRPYEPFADLVHQAHINRAVSKDGVIRQTWLKIQGPEGEVIPSLAYQAAEMAGTNLSKYEDWTDPKKTQENVAKNTLTIDYELTTDDFLTVSFIDVLEGVIPADFFKDALVFMVSPQWACPAMEARIPESRRLRKILS